MSKSASTTQQRRRRSSAQRVTETEASVATREFTKRIDQELRRKKGRMVYDFETQDFIEI